MSRYDILKHNQALRECVQPGPRRLEDGEVVFKIPTEDMEILARAYPDLVSTDNTARMKAWHALRTSPIGENYLVTRTPRQVKQSAKGIIIK